MGRNAVFRTETDIFLWCGQVLQKNMTLNELRGVLCFAAHMFFCPLKGF